MSEVITIVYAKRRRTTIWMCMCNVEVANTGGVLCPKDNTKKYPYNI